MKKLVCILITLLVASASLAATVPTDGLRLWYKMTETEGSTVHDSSGNGFDATKAWDVVWQGDSVRCTVDYSSLISVNDATTAFAPFTGNKVMSISLWVNNEGGDNDNGQWLYKSNVQGTSGTSTYGSVYSEYPSYGGSWWNMGAGNREVVWGAGDTGFDAWHNWTVVRDGVEMTVYRDGVEVGTDMKINTDGIYTGITDFVIGGMAGSSKTFKGSMHDFMVYNKALTVDDVADIYAATPEPTTIALLGFGALALIRRKK